MTGNRHKWRRIPTPAGVAALGCTAWQRDVADGHLSVFVGREVIENGAKAWHLSISHRTNEDRPRPGRYPSWNEVSEARYRFIPDGVTVAMLLPPRSEYVNVHATTFHLWEVS